MSGTWGSGLRGWVYVRGVCVNVYWWAGTGVGELCRMDFSGRWVPSLALVYVELGVVRGR